MIICVVGAVGFVVRMISNNILYDDGYRFPGLPPGVPVPVVYRWTTDNYPMVYGAAAIVGFVVFLQYIRLLRFYSVHPVRSIDGFLFIFCTCIL